MRLDAFRTVAICLVWRLRDRLLGLLRHNALNSLPAKKGLLLHRGRSPIPHRLVQALCSISLFTQESEVVHEDVDRPTASNDNAEGRANNRRVEIIIQPSNI